MKPIVVNISKKKKKQAKSQQRRAAPPVKEVSAIGRAIRALGAAGGSALGGMIGAPMGGASVGNNLGAALSKWIGFGDYTVHQNSLVQKASTGIPMMHKEGQSVVIRHREFVCQVRGSQSFSVQDSFRLNPGDSKTFPWLAEIANSFQQYKFRGVVFHYIPSSGSAVSSTNSALGTVMLQTSYRASDSSPASKAEMMNEYWAGEVVPSETVAHPIECDPKENPFNVQYVRGIPISGNDALMYDLGVTHLATAGQQADGFALGDLWVTYEVELKKPIVSSNVTRIGQFAANTYVSPTSGSAIFSGSLLPVQGNFEVSATANTLTLQKGLRGVFQAIVYVDSAVSFTAFTWPSTALVFTNATPYILNTGIGSAKRTNNTGATTLNGGVYIATFAITDPTLPTTVTFPAITLTGSIGTTTVQVTGYGPVSS